MPFHAFFKLGPQTPVLPRVDVRPPPAPSLSSHVAPISALAFGQVCAAVQTEEDTSREAVLDTSRLKEVQQALKECSQIVAANFSSLEFTPASFSVCTFAGSIGQWAVEKACADRCAQFLESLHSNLLRFDQLLDKIAPEDRTEYNALIREATRLLHVMQLTVADRYCLREAWGKKI